MYSTKEIKEQMIITHNPEKGICTARIPFEDIITMLHDDYYMIYPFSALDQVIDFAEEYLHHKAMVAKSYCNFDKGEEYIYEIGEDIARARLVAYFKKMECAFLNWLIKKEEKKLDILMQYSDKAERNYILTADKSSDIILGYYGDNDTTIIPMENAVDFDS